MNQQLELIGKRLMGKHIMVVPTLTDIVERVYVRGKLRPIKFFISKKDINKKKHKIKSR